MKRIGLAGVVLALVGCVLTGCGTDTDSTPVIRPSAVASGCMGSENGYQLEHTRGDDGSLQITDADMDNLILECILEKLSTDATQQLIQSTTPELGRQTREDGDYRFIWSVNNVKSIFGDDVPLLTLLIEIAG